MSRIAGLLLSITLLVSAVDGATQPISIPNASFEAGAEAAEGWTLKGDCRWAEGDAADGARFIAISGEGSCVSAPIAFEPGGIYELRVRYRYRPQGAAGGAYALVGPAFSVRVVSPAAVPGEPWQELSMRFVAPTAADRALSAVTLGQWMLEGTLEYDAVALHPVKLSHVEQEGVTLGEGEAISGEQHTFIAPLQVSRTISRPLAGYDADFHDNRWRFSSADDCVVYRHEVAGRRQVSATVKPTAWFHEQTDLELAVEASVNGADYRLLGTIGREDTGPSFEVPADMLPAEAVWIRLRCVVAGAGQPVFFQCTGYEYRATLDAAGPNVTGATTCLSVLREDPALVVEPATADAEGQSFTASVTNRGQTAVRILPTLQITGEDGAAETSTGEARELGPGASAQIVIPSPVLRPGLYRLLFTLGPDSQTQLAAERRVSVLHASHYGEALPCADPGVAVWWAASGWKVSRGRPAPTATGSAATIALARNETEGLQIVLRPDRDLRGLTATIGELRTEAGHTLPASCIELLRVRYVDVTQISDELGCTGQWPDPLPPLTAPIDLAAHANQPLWINARAPEDARAGLYRGEVTLRAEGFETRVPLQVRVHDFTLPKDTTCRSLFGWSPAAVTRYHNLKTEADKRLVMGKYLQSFAGHRISPYNPTPLDPLSYKWQTGSPWEGGRVVTDGAHAGEHCLRVQDTSETSCSQAVYSDSLPLSGEPLRPRLWYRTEAGLPAVAVVSFHDAAGMHIPYRNQHLNLPGSLEWQMAETTFEAPPEGAVSARLSLYACPWTPEGEQTGTLWVDEVSLVDTGTGEELIRDGGFEHSGVLSGELVAFDWDAWDGAMRRAVEDYRFGSFVLPVPGLGGGTFHSRRVGALGGYEQGTPEHTALFSAWCTEVRAHLSDMGLIGRAVVYPFDEPDEKDYDFVLDQLRLLGEHFPGLLRMVPMNLGAADVFEGSIDLWCPIMHTHNPQFAAARQAAGELYSWYICCAPKAPYIANFIDRPATDMRVWLWQTWQENVDGVLLWETTWWTSSAAYPEEPQNPYLDAMSWVDGYGTPRGEKRRWNVGDGRFLYPPEAATGLQSETVLQGPVSSIRWEALRDGMEDFEYLALLRGRLEARREKLTAAQIATYETLLRVPETISASLVSYTQDPAPLERHRARLAEAIEALGPQ